MFDVVRMREQVNKFQNSKAEQYELLEIKNKLLYDAPNMTEFVTLRDKIEAGLVKQEENNTLITEKLETFCNEQLDLNQKFDVRTVSLLKDFREFHGKAEK